MEICVETGMSVDDVELNVQKQKQVKMGVPGELISFSTVLKNWTTHSDEVSGPKYVLKVIIIIRINNSAVTHKWQHSGAACRIAASQLLGLQSKFRMLSQCPCVYPSRCICNAKLTLDMNGYVNVPMMERCII